MGVGRVGETPCRLILEFDLYQRVDDRTICSVSLFSEFDLYQGLDTSDPYILFGFLRDDALFRGVLCWWFI